MPAQSSAIAQHVGAAKRLLDELEQQAAAALDAIGNPDPREFLAAIGERDRILSELNGVVEALAHERIGEPEGATDTELLDEMAHAASAALESHQHLMARTQMERDRLAAALDRAKRPDNVAHHYAAATSGPRAATLSVTG